MATGSLKKVLEALLVVKEFSKYSGLHLNLEKTVIVSTLTPSRRSRRRLNEAGWGAICFAPAATYLGMLFGAKVTPMEVFAKAYDKFLDRLSQMRQVLEISSSWSSTPSSCRCSTTSGSSSPSPGA